MAEKNRIISVLFVFLLFPLLLEAQNLYLYHNGDYNRNMEQAGYSSKIHFHTSIRPWRVGDLQKITNYDSIKQLYRIDRTIEKKWKQKAWDKFLNDDIITLYRKDFWFAINPLMNFDFGYESNEKKTTFVNTRGFEAKGGIGKSFSFYTSFYENQASFVNYLDNYIRQTSIVPGQGKVRSFYGDGFDYAFSTAYIAFNAGKYFQFQLGYDKNFIGDGYRSLILSDNSFNYPFLKITANFWHIKYMVLYAQMMDIREKLGPSVGYQKKWATIHYLDWSVSKRVNIGIFEAIIWQNQDSTGYRGFDLSYLSPIIFLRPVEFSNGSPDNALLGLNASVIVGRHSVFYGQLILDEFKLKEMTSGNGWYGNKFGWQLGFKSYNTFNLKNLYFQTEFNWVRPYTFSHDNVVTNYGHYNAPLGHPMGANFWESVTFLKYNYRRFFFSYEFQYAQYGLDKDGRNYGKNIYESYKDRVNDYGNFVGQGLLTTVLYNDITVSWLINPAYNLNLAVGYTNRTSTNNQEKISTSFIHIGLRTSLGNFYYDF